MANPPAADSLQMESQHRQQATLSRQRAIDLWFFTRISFLMGVIAILCGGHPFIHGWSTFLTVLMSIFMFITGYLAWCTYYLAKKAAPFYGVDFTSMRNLGYIMVVCFACALAAIVQLALP